MTAHCYWTSLNLHKYDHTIVNLIIIIIIIIIVIIIMIIIIWNVW